jgi:hypothetical protein
LSRVSSVGIVTGYGLDGRDSISSRSKGPDLEPRQMGIGGSFVVGKSVGE